MGFNVMLPILAGVSIAMLMATQVGPKAIEMIKVKKLEQQAINTQDTIFEAVKRYIVMEQENPTTIQDLIDKNYLSGKLNNNGFGGVFSFSIDTNKGILSLYTTIEDKKAQQIFLNSIKNKFIPKQIDGTNDFVTNYVIPMDIMHGNGLFMSGIIAQKDAPDVAEHKYWYDTTTGEAILKISDGTSWNVVKGVGGGSSLPDYTDVSGELFKNGEQGDIKYVFDSTNKILIEYVHHNGKWTVLYKGKEDITDPDYISKPIDYTVLVGQKYKKDENDNLVLATVTCLGVPIGQTIEVEGVEYLVVDGGTGTYGIKNATNKARASTLCTSNVYNMSMMSFGSSFNQDISKWDTSNVSDMYRMFVGATSFNQYINDWDTSNVINMDMMFNNATSFNQPLNNWNTSNVTGMIQMFEGATSFNQPLYNWNTSKVQNMQNMFYGATSFNQYLSSWDTGNVTIMDSMFKGATSFNNGDNIGQNERPLTWNTSKVTNMNYMFSSVGFNGPSSFNQQLLFDTSKVINMQSMFYGAILFNQDIGSWNTSKVNTFWNMFAGAISFNNGCAEGVENCPMNWTINTTSNVDMRYMFDSALSFNQDLSGWNISKVTNRTGYDLKAGLWEAEHKPLFP